MTRHAGIIYLDISITGRELLAVKSYTGVNPMTAVAEGASIFAESINWERSNHERKSQNADINLCTRLGHQALKLGLYAS